MRRKAMVCAMLFTTMTMAPIVGQTQTGNDELSSAGVGAAGPGGGGYGYGQPWCPGAGGMMGGGMMGGGMGGMGMMGMGMMGGGMRFGAFNMLNLNDDQRAKINSIQDSLRKQHWTLMGRIQDEQAKLRDLYASEQPDPKRIGAVAGTIGDLRRQIVEAEVQAMNQARGVLTPEQQAQLQQWKRSPRGPMAGQGLHGGMMGW